MAGLFEIGKSGLDAYRKALSVAGQNIANINTDGYKRREVSLSEVQGSSGGVTEIATQSGIGVRVEGIKRSFDEFLLNKARNARSYSENINTYVEKISDLEDLLLPGDANISSAISRLFESLQEVASNPNDLASRKMVINNANYLADVFHQAVNLTSELKEGITTQTDQAIKEVNYLTTNLANVNRNLISSSSQSKNGLFDNRDAILDKLSNYINFTVSLDNSGVAAVNLGDTGNGPTLVKYDKSYKISSGYGDENLNFYVTKGTSPSLTKQLTGGNISGLSDAFYTVTNSINILDELAYKLISDINAVHSEGMDLEGNIGGLFFNEINFEANSSLSNLSNSSATVNITDASQIISNSITLQFSENEDSWNAFDSYGRKLGTGRKEIFLSGMIISVDGDPKNDDQIILKPMQNAAAAISVALQRPESIAAALPFEIEADIANDSSSKLIASKEKQNINNDLLPKIADVLSNGHTAIGSSSFMRDGLISVVPSNVENLDLLTLIQQSSIQFSVPDAAVDTITNFSITIDDGIQAAKTYTFDLDDYINTINSNSDLSNEDKFYWSDASKIADLINVGALKATNTVDVDNVTGDPIEFTLSELGGYISGSESNFNLSLNTDDIISGSVNFASYPQIEGIVKPRIDSASDIQIFTREGRHLAGSYSESLDSLITSENGFHDEAVYRGDYLNSSGDEGYMGMNISYQSNYSEELIKIEDTETGHIITFDRMSSIDGSDHAGNGLNSTANIFDYALSVDNISISLSESNVYGDSSNEIAQAALSEIRNSAPISSLTGVSSIIATNTITLTADEKTSLDNNGSLKVTYDDIDYYLTYENNSYSIQGGRADQLSLSFDGNLTITTTYPSLPTDGDSLVLSFEGKEYTLTMSDSEIIVTGGEQGRILASYDEDFILNISSNGGSISASEIEILGDDVISNNTTMALNFGLISNLNSPTTSYSYNSGTYDPSDIGTVYTAPNYDFELSGNSIIIVKNEDYLDQNITLSSSVDSKASSRVTLTDLPDEELLIFITGSDDGNGARARAISASYDINQNQFDLIPRNITLKVTDAENKLFELIDTETGTSVATRTLNDQSQTSALGYFYELDGAFQDNDRFYITNNSGGVFDNRNLIEIINLNDDTKTNNTFKNIFSSLVMDIGTDIQANKINAEAAEALRDSSIEAEAMYSGVNLDSEASNLIEYQQAYQASARILQTAREIFQTLLDTI